MRMPPSAKDHILFIAPTAYPLGGVSVWLHYLMNGLRDNDQFHVTFGAVSGHFHDHQVYLEHYPFAQVEVIDCGSGSQHARICALMKVIDKVKPSIVVCVNIPDLYLCVRKLRLSGQGRFKLVSTIHGILPRLFSDLNEYDDVIDHIIVTNHLTRLMVLETTKFEQHQIFYAPYGVDHEALAKPVARVDNTDSKTLNILYCGRIDNTQKRCQDLLGITRELSELAVDYRLLIAGDGPYKAELMRKLDPEKTVDLGLLKADEVAVKAYQKASVLLLTSEWETGPIVIWEALASSLPVVTSRYHGLQAEGSLVHDEHCLIYQIGDHHAAAHALGKVTKQELRDRLIGAGHALIESKYSRAKSITAWSNVFATIAERAVFDQDQSTLKPYKPKLKGRLDAYLGVALADTVRRSLGWRVTMNSAGDEWPHAHTGCNQAFLAQFSHSIISLEGDYNKPNRAIE